MIIVVVFWRRRRRVGPSLAVNFAKNKALPHAHRRRLLASSSSFVVFWRRRLLASWSCWVWEVFLGMGNMGLPWL
jgi:hypothetical protein